MPSSRLSPEERLVRATKHLDLTLDQVKAEMDGSSGNLNRPLRVPRMRGYLRLVVRCRHSSPTSWAMSVILNSGRFDGRIDCIDWEALFVSADGRRCSGFHRHVWNAKAMNCDSFKVPLPTFKPETAEAFLIDGLKLLNVVLRKGEPHNVGDQMRLT